MENFEKEIGKFYLGVRLLLNQKGIKPEFSSRDFNMPKEVLITQLRTFIKLLERDYYPDFKNNINTISGPPEDL